MLKRRPKKTLAYFISETHFYSKDYSLLVVNLVGSIAQETLPVLQECQEHIKNSASKFVILNFRDISQESDASILSLFDALQKAIRQRPVMLKFSGLHPQLRKILIAEKILAEEDLFNNLAEALQSATALPVKEEAA
jgi:anti-anti-sigma regulatory factor